MFGSSILEVAIGLVFVYLLLSLICSAIQESLEGWLKIRATNLEQGLRELLQDKDGKRLVKHIYNHPMIYGLFRGEYDPDNLRKSQNLFSTELPTYIPATNFAVALIDTLIRGPVQREPAKNDPPQSGELTIDALRSAVFNNASLCASMQRMLLLSIDSAQGDLSKATAKVEEWFNSSMERVSGWYKRRIHAILLMLGLGVAVLFNVDSMKIADELYHNNELRATVAAQAEIVGKQEKIPSAEVKGLMTSLNSLNLPIGWRDKNSPLYDQITKAAPGSILGWLLTAFAISFGAPFWFDLLNRLIALRSTTKPQEKTTKETPPQQEKKTVTLQGATETAVAPSPSLAAGASMDYSAFKSHEWSSGDDPQGGVL